MRHRPVDSLCDEFHGRLYIAMMLGFCVATPQVQGQIFPPAPHRIGYAEPGPEQREEGTSFSRPRQVASPIFSGSDAAANHSSYPKFNAPAGNNASPSFIRDVSQHSSNLEIILGQGRLITLEDELSKNGIPAFVAVGDPAVLEFEIIGPRQIRVTGQTIGVTDLSITTTENHTHSIEVHVLADLEVLSMRLQSMFPGAQLKLSHLRNHIVVEGQARDVAQADRILQTIDAFLAAVHASQMKQVIYGSAPQPVENQQPNYEYAQGDGRQQSQPQPVGRIAGPDLAPRPVAKSVAHPPQVINLIRIPGAQQVLLKVQIAELNQTALRQHGVRQASAGHNAAFGSRSEWKW